jgi:hypothetical protein
VKEIVDVIVGKLQTTNKVQSVRIGRKYSDDDIFIPVVNLEVSAKWK